MTPAHSHPPTSTLRRRLAAQRPGRPTTIACAIAIALAATGLAPNRRDTDTTASAHPRAAPAADKSSAESSRRGSFPNPSAELVATFFHLGGGLTARQLYWLGMTHRVGTKGQVVIPKPLRERQGLGPGVTVSFEERPDGVLVRAEAGPEQLRGRYRGTGMAAKLLEDRSAEPR